MDDKEVSQILVVTQNPRARDATKRTLDRTGDFETRAKMSAEMAKAINDGLVYYEKVTLDWALNVCLVRVFTIVSLSLFDLYVRPEVLVCMIR